jgi:hypothetical protein
MRNAYKNIVGIYEEKRELGRHNNGRQDNVTINVKERGCEMLTGIHLVQDRDQWQARINAVVNRWVP